MRFYYFWKYFIPLLTFLIAVLFFSPFAFGQGVYPSWVKPKDILKGPLLKPEQVLRPGDIFRDCEECPEMVVLDVGAIVVGSEKYASEKPTRLIRFNRPFAIGRFEIQHSEWQSCIDQKGCSHHPDDHEWGHFRMPVINVNFGMVENFARWLSKKTGKTYRLPSEVEWEYAARAGSRQNYWFGEKVGKGRVNCRKCGTPWSGIGNAPVGSFAPNPWGLYDMHGNAFEWVQDCWHNNFTNAPNSIRAWIEGDCRFRVIKGGSWYYFSRMARSANRQKNLSEVKSYWLSFRLVREID